MTPRGLFFRLALIPTLLAIMAFWTVPLQAQEEPGGSTLDVEEPAILMLGPRLITVFRSTVYGFTPKARVEASTARIRDAIADDRPAEFTTVVRSEGTLIYYGEHLLCTITHGDLDQQTGQTMDEKVQSALTALRAGFAQARRGRDPTILARAIGKTILFTISYLLLVLATVLTSRALDRLLRARLGARHITRELLLDALGIARRFIWFAIFVAVTLAWLSLVLQSFPQTELAGDNLVSSFATAFSGLLSSAIAAAPNLLIALVIIAFLFTLLHSVNVLLKAVLRGRVKLRGIDEDVARPTATMVKFLLLIGGIITAYPYLPGTSSEAFQGISLMVGLIVSLGSATLFGQISAGFVLMYSGAFKRGDWLSLNDGTEGRLVEIGYLTTKIQTFREEISVPNLVLLGQATRNLSRAPVPNVAPLLGRVSIGYDAPWRQVYRLLQEAAAHTPGILADPPPVVHQVELGDFYVTYELTAYITRETPRRAVRSNLYENIQDAFNRAGVQIMSPHYEGNPAAKVVVPPGGWEGTESPDSPGLLAIGTKAPDSK